MEGSFVFDMLSVRLGGFAVSLFEWIIMWVLAFLLFCMALKYIAGFGILAFLYADVKQWGFGLFFLFSPPPDSAAKNAKRRCGKEQGALLPVSYFAGIVCFVCAKQH